MPASYIPGVWASKYRRLAPLDRQTVNDLTNQIFRERTHVYRKLVPGRDAELCAQWLRIRDEVMQEREHPAFRGEGFLGLPSAQQIYQGAQRGADVVGDVFDAVMQSAETPWMDVARRELERGVEVQEGKAAHPRIMEYAQTCPHLFATENKRKYMAREGDEGFKWCSTFVNWCMQQVGIVGTRNARALSWQEWGRPIGKPQHGAVIILKTKSWNHVAFVEDMGSEFKMLGGNQKPEHGSGPHCVSYQRIIPAQVVGYRLPA